MVLSKNNILKYSILVMPFIDILNGLMIKLVDLQGFGILVRMCFLILYLYDIYGKTFKMKELYLLYFSTFIIVQNFVMNFFEGVEITYQFATIIKYIYFFCVCLIIQKYQEDREFYNTIKKYYTIVYPLAIIIPMVLGMQLTTYGEVGTIGFMTSVNAYSYILIICLYWALDSFMKKMNWKNIVLVLYNMSVVFLIGSKSTYIFALIIFLYIIFKNLKKTTINNLLKILIFLFSILMFCLIIYFVFNSEIQKIISRFYYLVGNRTNNSFESIMNLLTSNRWSRISEYYLDFKEHMLFGLGYGYFYKHITPEMDVINLLYIFGFFGFIFYFFVFYKIVVCNLKKKRMIFSFSFIISFIYLFFGGHVLADAMANTVFAIIVFFESKGKEHADNL